MLIVTGMVWVFTLCCAGPYMQLTGHLLLLGPPLVAILGGYFLVAACGLLVPVASLVAEHRL